MVIASSNNIRSYATFVDTSYHANPDPLGDGSGIAYYRLNNQEKVNIQSSRVSRRLDQ